MRSPMARSTALAVRGARGSVTILPPFRVTVSVRWPRSRPSASILAPSASEIRSPLSRPERHQGVITSRGQAGGDEQRAELVAVKTGGMRLVIQPRAPDMDRRRVLDHTFLLGIAKEAGDRAQAPRHRRPGLPFRFKITGETLDVDPPSSEQPKRDGQNTNWRTAGGPTRRPRGSPPVAGQKPRQGLLLPDREPRLDTNDLHRRLQCDHLLIRGRTDHEGSGPATKWEIDRTPSGAPFPRAEDVP